MSDSILQVNQIKDKGGNATGITVADSTANVTVGNLTATTAAINAGSIGSSVTIPAATGSSLVLLKTSAPSGSGNTGTDLDNFYSSSYDNYLLLGAGVKFSADSGNVTFQWLKNDGNLESGTFYHFSGKGRRSDGNDFDLDVNSNDAGYLVPSMGASGREGASFAFTINNMTNSNLNTILQGTVQFHHYQNGPTMLTLGNQFDYGLDFRGIRIYAAGSGNTFQSTTKFSIYGYKNS